MVVDLCSGGRHEAATEMISSTLFSDLSLLFFICLFPIISLFPLCHWIERADLFSGAGDSIGRNAFLDSFMPAVEMNFRGGSTALFVGMETQGR